MPGSGRWCTPTTERWSIDRAGHRRRLPAPGRQSPILPVCAGRRRSTARSSAATSRTPLHPRLPAQRRAVDAWWDASFPRRRLDGVLAFDPVAMSYLLDSTGPVQVGDVTPHLGQRGRGAAEQALPRAGHRRAGRVLRAGRPGRSSTRSPATSSRRWSSCGAPARRPTRAGSSRVVRRRRSRPAGRHAGRGRAARRRRRPRPTSTSRVNDATGSKMSYYLRYRAERRGPSCSKDGTQ